MNKPLRHHKPFRHYKVSPPGETLKDLLEEWEMSTFDLAEMMEYPLEIVERVINRGEAMSKEFIIALSFVKMKGAFQSYDFWTERNKKYVKWLEKQEDDSKP